MDEIPIPQIRQSQFWSAIRATPVFVPAFALMNLIYHPSQQALNFVLGTGVVYAVNQGLKFAFRHMYSIPWLEPKLHMLIGQGTRPAGATNTASFLVYPAGPSSTFGMPSGHSQTAWYLSAYIIGSLALTPGTTTKHLSVTTLVTCTYALLVSYSRVYIDRVHTIQQVILGAMLGVLCGLLCI
jgi:membrane-associated phospholipid phosphatase